MSVTVKDNTAQVQAQLNSNIERALTAMGLTASGAIKSYMAKEHIRDTGTLMGSITSSVSGERSVDVGTNVEYATFVHEGTSKMKGRPYIKNGINGAIDKIQEVAEQELKKCF